jgi:Zn-dependent protease/CBS domain-containing protein
MNGNRFRVASIAGINVYIHWSWLIIFALLTWSLGDFYYTHFHSWNRGTAYAVAATSAILLFVTVLLHELAHSFTARGRGLPVNTITLYLFGGVSSLTQEPSDAGTELQVALAGPLTSLALAGLCFLLFLAGRGSWPSEVTAILNYLAVINLLLAAFNMIPGFPLDGGRVFRSIVWLITKNRRRATSIASTLGQVIGYLFIVAGLLAAFFGADVVGGIYLAFIGWFLQNAASASNQQAVIESVLRGVDVRDVMDPTPDLAPASLSIEALVDRYMLNQNRRAVPVGTPDGEVQGLVTLADVRNVPRDEWIRTSISRVMRPRDQLRTVKSSDHLADALRVLAENRYHQLPVMDDGHIVGMLNRDHVLQYINLRQRLGPRELEELRRS